MPEQTPLEQLVRDRMAALRRARGDIGQRLSPSNPSKALRRLDAFAATGALPEDNLCERLAGALGLPVTDIADAARATRKAIEAQAEADYRARFEPHAIWTTARSQPSSTAMAGFINAPARLRLPFPSGLPTEGYVAYCQDQAPSGIPLYGPVTGFIINYTPDHARRYDLEGQPLETLQSAFRVGSALTRV
ncbi:hypothetical protein [Spiribacter sp. SSL99]|uniref:hypothetical protein n=1 Tax=Spiribacter sp. SSL99 TaxID=1866884 RepID=UPI00132F7844|nr:hypothetical protein [Spiribacter sp. SSL99]